MRYDSSTYSTLNPADKWKTLPQHQNINSRKRVFPRQQQQQQSSLALNGANVFKNGNHAMSKRHIQPTAANMQYHSNRSYLQFAGKAKIHVPKVQNRLDYSLPTSKTNINRFVKNRNDNTKPGRFSSSFQKKQSQSYYSIRNVVYRQTPGHVSNNRNAIWSKATLQRGGAPPTHSQVNISAANLQSSRQTFGSFGSPSLANGSFNSSLGQSLNNRYQRAGTKAFNGQAERSGPGYATLLASRSGATNVANEVRNTNISLEKQEIALHNLRREQIEYYDKQKKLQVQDQKDQNAETSFSSLKIQQAHFSKTVIAAYPS